MQQAVEKGLKGLLAARGIEPPRTHLLQRLYHLLEKAGEPRAEGQELVAALQRFSVLERYPVLLPVVASSAGLEAHVPQVEALVRLLERRLGVGSSEGA